MRFLVFFACLCATALGLAPAAAAPPKFVSALAAGKPQTVVVYGTSLTAGGAWVGLLRDALDAKYPGLTTLVNSGGSGQYSAWGTKNLDTHVLAKKPDAVFIEFAVNDAVARFNCPLETARTNLQEMIDRIAAARPECEIFLQVMNPVIGKPPGDRSYRHELESYYAMYRETAAARKLGLIDHGPAWKKVLAEGDEAFRKLVPDGVHPTPEAAKIVLLPTLLAALQLNADAAPASAAGPKSYDVVIYGGTSAAVVAAAQAKKLGKTVIVVSPDKHLGGLSSGGLGFTDTGNKAAIGGLAREFYHRIWKHYDDASSWTFQKKEQYGNKGQGTPAIDGEQRTMWIFEPHAAEKVFEDFVREHEIPVIRDEWLDRKTGVRKEGSRITAITMLSGNTYHGKMFVDATYEGDLLAAAGAEYHVGREANSKYDEKFNGVQTGVLHHRHHFGVFKTPIDPYVIPGDPSSGLLPRITAEKPGPFGSEDKKVQAYCFRMCLTNEPENRVPFAKPEGYDPKQYELMARVYANGWKETFEKFDPIPNKKTDTNNHGPFSTDNIGFNYDYPEADYARRKAIIREHEVYQQGWLYFVSTDPRVPEDVRKEMSTWGLAKDEFKDNGHWPHQMYIREARRLVGKFVMSEHEVLNKKPIADSVGMGSYTLDSHNVQRYVTPEGHVQNEGDIGVKTNGPYRIAYGSIVPKEGQCDNLFAPVCVSSSHIAYGSIRMEPVFMILGQSAATAAAIAIDDNLSVQQVPYEKLRTHLLRDGQVLELAVPAKK